MIRLLSALVRRLISVRPRGRYVIRGVEMLNGALHGPETVEQRDARRCYDEQRAMWDSIQRLSACLVEREARCLTVQQYVFTPDEARRLAEAQRGETQEERQRREMREFPRER